MLFSTEPRQLGALAAAVGAGEITPNELSDALGSLTAEAIQVLSFLIRSSYWNNNEDSSLRLVRASRICTAQARAGRCLS